MTTQSQASLHELLKSEFDRRKSKNPRYSLRAFAKQIEMSHASLSHLMRGKRNFTRAQVERIGLIIGLDSNAIHNFQQTSKEGHATKSEYSDWLTIAILEIVSWNQKIPSAQELADLLKIDIHRIQNQIENLKSLGWIRLEDDKALDESPQHIQTSPLRRIIQLALRDTI